MALPHIDYHAVVDAAARHKTVCPLCAAIDEAERAFWDSVLFSQVGTEGFQDQFLATDGFCRPHARDFAARKDGTAVTMLYVPLMRHRRNWISRSNRPVLLGSHPSSRKEHPAIRAGRRAGRHACLLCDRIDHWADRFLINLLRHQHDATLRAALEAGTGLCVPHYRRLMELSGRGRVLGLIPGGPERVPRVAQWLETLHTQRWNALTADAEAAAHARGDTVWKRLIATMEGGTGWE
ncbi:MAG TPA: DUF6062 family protein [Alkalispirochaeta sp.]|nr:DUF6062 family protein [Alkalispirochaeta sp.]